MNNVKEIASGFVLLILTYLLVKNGKDTSTVIQAIGNQTSSVTKALQGR